MAGEATPQGYLPGRYAIEAYGRGGFRFAGMSHRGSILILPSGVHAWEVGHPEEITAKALAAVLRETPRVEFLLIGTGTSIAPLPDRLRAPFRDLAISVDAMQTGAAARTYNVLLAEERRVAAALIAVA